MRHIASIGKHLFLMIASIVSLFPFLLMIMGMTNTSSDIVKGRFSFVSNFAANISNLFEGSLIVDEYVNFLIIAVIGTVLTLVLCSAAGYGFEVYRSKNKDRLFGFLLFSILMAFAAIMIALFKMFSQWGLLH